jgi:ubiquinone/menaquinone biosynthesis C-methylase UbiE
MTAQEKTANFDRLARIYRALEVVAFGRDLERTRFCLLDRLHDRKHILVLGEGDGRCLARLVRLAPQATIHCVDASAAMLRAAARRLPADARHRVTFTQSDVFAQPPPPTPYDAVVTLFFLDCFTTEQVALMVREILPCLSPEARWLFGDFVLPPRGWARFRAEAWLALLYTFFRWQTGLRTRRLPEAEHVLESAGFQVEASESRQHGLLHTVLFRLSPFAGRRR